MKFSVGGLKQPGSFLFVPKRSMWGEGEEPCVAWARCWEPVCEHIPGGRGQGGQPWILSPHAGQTQTQQAEEVALGEVRPGLEEMG